jgi:hypothetical protein
MPGRPYKINLNSTGVGTGPVIIRRPVETVTAVVAAPAPVTRVDEVLDAIDWLDRGFIAKASHVIDSLNTGIEKLTAESVRYETYRKILKDENAIKNSWILAYRECQDRLKDEDDEERREILEKQSDHFWKRSQSFEVDFHFRISKSESFNTTADLFREVEGLFVKLLCVSKILETPKEELTNDKNYLLVKRRTDLLLRRIGLYVSDDRNLQIRERLKDITPADFKI